MKQIKRLFVVLMVVMVSVPSVLAAAEYSVQSAPGLAQPSSTICNPAAAVIRRANHVVGTDPLTRTPITPTVTDTTGWRDVLTSGDRTPLTSQKGFSNELNGGFGPCTPLDLIPITTTSPPYKGIVTMAKCAGPGGRTQLVYESKNLDTNVINAQKRVQMPGTGFFVGHDPNGRNRDYCQPVIVDVNNDGLPESAIFCALRAIGSDVVYMELKDALTLEEFWAQVVTSQLDPVVESNVVGAVDPFTGNIISAESTRSTQGVLTVRVTEVDPANGNILNTLTFGPDNVNGVGGASVRGIDPGNNPTDKVLVTGVAGEFGNQRLWVVSFDRNFNPASVSQAHVIPSVGSNIGQVGLDHGGGSTGILGFDVKDANNPGGSATLGPLITTVDPATLDGRSLTCQRDGLASERVRDTAISDDGATLYVGTKSPADGGFLRFNAANLQILDSKSIKGAQAGGTRNGVEGLTPYSLPGSGVLAFGSVQNNQDGMDAFAIDLDQFGSILDEFLINSLDSFMLDQAFDAVIQSNVVFGGLNLGGTADLFLVRLARAQADVCGDGSTTGNEQCDDGNTLNGDCCSSTCQFESSGTLCRPAAGPCDADEFCTGTSGTCPADLFQPFSFPGLPPCPDPDPANPCVVPHCNGQSVFCDLFFDPNQASPEGPTGSQSCFDGVDNDCDGLTDQQDPGCQGAAACTTTLTDLGNAVGKDAPFKKAGVQFANAVMLPKGAVQQFCNLLDAPCVWANLAAINTAGDPVVQTNANGQAVLTSNVFDPNGWAIYVSKQGASAAGYTITSGTTEVAVANTDCAPNKQIQEILSCNVNTLTCSAATGRQQQIQGSLLDILYPEAAIWEAGASSYLYPFIMTSDSQWTVDMCAQVPAGYTIQGVYDENGQLVVSSECMHSFVTGQTKVIAFDVVKTGSPPEWAMKARIKAKSHKGKVTTLDLNVPTKVKQKKNQLTGASII